MADKKVELPVIGTITKAGKGEYWRFPSQPEEIKVKTSAHMQKFTLVNLGSVTWQHGTEPVSVSWDGKFWGEDRKDLKYLLDPGEWVPPISAAEHVNNFKKNQEKLLLFISHTDINFVCQVSSFDYTYTGGHGDIEYSITFTQYGELKIVQTASDSTKAQTKGRTNQQPQTKEKTVKTNGSPLRLRSDAGGKIIGRMPNGTKITTDGKTKGGWTHVKYKNTWGWAYTAWMK